MQKCNISSLYHLHYTTLMKRVTHKYMWGTIMLYNPIYSRIVKNPFIDFITEVGINSAIFKKSLFNLIKNGAFQIQIMRLFKTVKHLIITCSGLTVNRKD